VLIAMTETGGRKSEVLGLKWEDVALDRGVLYFSQTNTKNARQREIPLTALLADTLRELAKVKAIRGNAREYVFTRFGKPMRDIRTAFQKARERAGLGPEVTVHSLRRGFATLYASRSGDPYLLKELLGHQDLKTTQIYIGLSEAHRRAAVPMMGINGVPAQNGHKSVTDGKSATA
jgi:integrase